MPRRSPGSDGLVVYGSECVFPCFLLLRFATLENSGLLFYNGRFNEKHDFIALEIKEGQVVLKYSTGTKTLQCFANTHVNDLILVHCL